MKLCLKPHCWSEYTSLMACGGKLIGTMEAPVLVASCRWAHPPPQAGQRPNAAGTGDRSDPGHRKGNNCSYCCPALACRSNDYPEKSAKCICRYTSPFDVSQLLAGKQMIIKILRDYGKAHPDAVNLKQVDLKVTKAGSGGNSRPIQALRTMPTAVAKLVQQVAM